MRNLIFAAVMLSAGTAAAEPRSMTADIWVDNWFEMYANGTKVIEDSVPITTERSFNAESITFEAELPMTIAIMAKDFKENDSGLEYIGSRRQQVGDGGMIAQFHDAASGQILGATNASMRCLVVHHAPVDLACAKENDPVAGQGVCGFEQTPIPADWTSPGFDDSAWPLAVEHSAEEVSPKGGYDQIRWDASAKLVWSESLKQDNTLLCRAVISE